MYLRRGHTGQYWATRRHRELWPLEFVTSGRDTSKAHEIPMVALARAGPKCSREGVTWTLRDYAMY